MGWTTEESGFDCRVGQDAFLVSMASRPDLGPMHSPTHRIAWAVPPGKIGRNVKLTWPISILQVKYSGAVPPLYAMVFN
jgi:hypothetical protein